MRRRRTEEKKERASPKEREEEERTSIDLSFLRNVLSFGVVIIIMSLQYLAKKLEVQRITENDDDNQDHVVVGVEDELEEVIISLESPLIACHTGKHEL